jgi:hypothetical protein
MKLEEFRSLPRGHSVRKKGTQDWYKIAGFQKNPRGIILIDVVAIIDPRNWSLPLKLSDVRIGQSIHMLAYPERQFLVHQIHADGVLAIRTFVVVESEIADWEPLIFMGMSL